MEDFVHVTSHGSSSPRTDYGYSRITENGRSHGGDVTGTIATRFAEARMKARRRTKTGGCGGDDDTLLYAVLAEANEMHEQLLQEPWQMAHDRGMAAGQWSPSCGALAGVRVDAVCCLRSNGIVVARGWQHAQVSHACDVLSEYSPASE